MTTSECSHVEALKAELLAAERREQALKARLDAAVGDNMIVGEER